jgi:hypothetical protein
MRHSRSRRHHFWVRRLHAEHAVARQREVRRSQVRGSGPQDGPRGLSVDRAILVPLQHALEVQDGHEYPLLVVAGCGLLVLIATKEATWLS